MKKISGVVVFTGRLIFGSMLLWSCFNPPEFPTTPQIEFNKVEFKEVGGFSDQDSLIVYINFKDGDGDLGLSTQDLDSPVHVTNFFTGTNGQLTTIASAIFDLSNLRYASNSKSPKSASYVLQYIPKNTGKLISSKDIGNPQYGMLPPFEAPYSTCTNSLKAYLTDTVFVERPFKYALDPSTIVDSLRRANGPIVLYAVLASWYIESNDRNYNITVQFQVKNSTDTGFHDFDWRKEYCTTFDGRFPVLADKHRPIEGTLRYGMTSTGFLTLFRVSTLRLRIQIQDRNFNKSNVVRSQQFTLNEIRK
jgi:hypothetical protein